VDHPPLNEDRGAQDYQDFVADFKIPVIAKGIFHDSVCPPFAFV